MHRENCFATFQMYGCRTDGVNLILELMVNSGIGIDYLKKNGIGIDKIEIEVSYKTT